MKIRIQILVYFCFRGLDILRISVIFTREKTDFFAFPHTVQLLIRGLQGKLSMLLKYRPFSQGRQNHLNRVASLKMYQFSIKNDHLK